MLEMYRTLAQAIFGLPDTLSGSILSFWLDLVTVCRLDSAVCNKSTRVTFQNLLQRIECVGLLSALNNEQLAWMNKRSISSTEFCMTDDTSEEESRQFLQRSGASINVFCQFCTEPNAPSLQLVVQYCHNLLKMCLLAPYQLSECFELLRTNRNLIELTLTDNCNGDDTFPVSDLSLPNLRYIRLESTIMSDVDILILLKTAPNLVFLALPYAIGTSVGLVEAIRLCPKLRFLEPPNQQNIDYTLISIVDSCVYLEHLCLTACTNLTDAGIIAVAENVKGLRSIKFTYATNVTDMCLNVLAKQQHSTLEIFIVGKTYGSWFDLPNVMEAVEEPKLPFSSEALTAFREKCTRLCVFDIHWRILIRGEDNTEEIVCYIANAVNVTKLNLTYVNNSILHAIASYCMELRVLDLFDIWSRDVTLCSDTLWLDIAEHCTKLHSIVVDDDATILRKQLEKYPTIIKKCPDIILSLDDLYQQYKKLLRFM